MNDVVAPSSSKVPSLTVSSLVFSDGTAIELDRTDLVVLVGPNNSGKSMALKQIEAILSGKSSNLVISNLSYDLVGSPDAIRDHLKSQSRLINYRGTPYYVGYDYKIIVEFSDRFGNGLSDDLRDFFVLRCSTDERLSGSNSIDSISYQKEPPSHPAHLLVIDKSLERKISLLFYQAFNQYLYVNRAGGSEVELFVGARDFTADNSDAFDSPALEFFENDAIPLEVQGDGMRAFATIALNSLAISQQTVLLIDEPEAFLHPPQARLLGRIIASEGDGKRQTFLATHSADILKGVVEDSQRSIRIIRINRNGKVNYVKNLDKDLIKDFSRDPLIRYSGIFEGIFFSHIVLCESDTDCHFYGALLNTRSVSGEKEPDVLFVQSSGKHRLGKLGAFANQLGISFSMIVDIDVLNERKLFKDLIESCGGNWSSVEPLWVPVYDAISAQKVGLTSIQLIASIQETLEKLKKQELTVSKFLADIRERIRINSPWENLKRAGRNGLPFGDVVQKFDALLEVCGSYGLWIVPVGELEGFCRTIKGKKGSNWIVELLEREDLENSSELEQARSFMRRIWSRMS